MKRADKRQLLVDHYLDFYSVAMAIVRDEQDAKDAVQEALVRTMTKGGIDDVCGYCVRTVKNLCLNMLKHRSRLVEVDEMMLVTDVDHDRLLRIVAEKKEELSELAKAVLELHFEEGYTLSEVAGMLEINVPKLKRILADAKYDLKKKLLSEI
ncbi:MAG: RNA polymerase sigma factor [bacterium]